MPPRRLEDLCAISSNIIGACGVYEAGTRVSRQFERCRPLLFGLLRSRFIQIRLNHQSNGRGKPLSRNWNRFVANFSFERNDFSLILKTWARISGRESKDDNRDITSYFDYGEIWAGTVWRNYHLALMFRNNFRFNENRSAMQLEVSFLQYFTGYGESLIDYNHFTNRIGVGVIVKYW